MKWVEIRASQKCYILKNILKDRDDLIDQYVQTLDCVIKTVYSV